MPQQTATTPSRLLAQLQVEEAALGLQLAKMRSLAGDGFDGELLSYDQRDRKPHIVRLVTESRHTVSVNQGVPSLEGLRQNYEDNLRAVAAGVRMESNYDTRNLNRPVLEFLATAELPYYACYGPVQMKLLDGERVLIHAPVNVGPGAILHTDDPSVVAAAKTYVRAVRATAVPAAEYLERQRVTHPEAGDPGELLTERQRRIAELLDAGSTDEQAARALGVSVRTIGTEMSRLMQVLGARNRFAAGRRYGELG